MKKNRIFYYSEDKFNEYDGAYEDFIAVEEKYNQLFLYDIQREGRKVELISNPSEDIIKEADKYIPEEIRPPPSVDIQDITNDLKKEYCDFLTRWGQTGQNPNEWGCSIGGQLEADETIMREAKKVYPEKKYINDKFEKELDYRKETNKENSERKELYKNINIKLNE